MKKKITGLMLLLILAISLQSVSVKASTMNSGRSGVPKLSFEQLAGMYDSIHKYSSLYAVSPTVSKSGYSVATLSNDALMAGLTNINYYRTVAGVANVSLTYDLNLSSAYGALVCAGNGAISHTPAQPSGMDSSMYATGSSACSNSNLSYAGGYSQERIIPLAISGQMADASGSNLATLGHRRWLLSPNVSTMGIGSASSGNSYYTAVRVMGDGVVSDKTVNDYNFISWPASGNNLSDTFASNTPWSITLNPYRYSTSLGNAVVTLTESNTGKTWTFNSATGTSTSRSSNYFTVNTNGYGINNCIIFRPAYANIDTFKGDYVVTLSGIYTKSGASTSISYTVSFQARKNIASVDNTYALNPNNYNIATSIQPTTDSNAPAKTTLAKAVSQKKKSITMVWKKNASANGYVVQCSTKANFKGSVKTVKVSSSTLRCKITKLKSKKKYYTRVCAYRVVSGTTYYGAWSATKAAKAK